jgi:UDP-glucose 4-epimerase
LTESVAGHCLVTGSTGFIGRALVQRLRADGATVRGVARSRHESCTGELIVADLTSGPLHPGLLDGIDTIYHLAAKTHDLKESGDVEKDYWRVNVDATRYLIEALQGRTVRRLVLVSSVKAVTEGGPRQIDETYEPKPTTAYGRSKLAAERLVWSETIRHGVTAVCVRFPLVYGPEQRGNFDRMIAAIDRGLFPPPPGTGNRRSMLHVENAVDALMVVGRHPDAAGHTYFVTDARPYETREVYSWIRQALGKSTITWSCPEWTFRALAGVGDAARATLGRRVGFDREAFEKLLGSAWYSCAKIARELGYQPKRDLCASVPEMVATYRARRRIA